MKRETAWRVFAGEFNDSTLEIKGEGDMSPSYIITPLGAKINRLFIIGVLTDVENISEEGDMLRAHISDPTGVFTIYSGEYQKDATDALSNIEVPAFVAVIGKTNAYTPEEGNILVSIRPEKVIEVNSMTRDQWILETCKITKNRIEAVLEAMKLSDKNVDAIKKLGYSMELSEGITEALKNYNDINLEKYVSLIQESLEFLKPVETDSKKKEKKDKTIDEPIKEKEEKTEDIKDFEDKEKTVFEIIRSLEGEDGASWDSITEKCSTEGLDQDSIEEVLNSLMDKGLIYEPILGTIKTT